MPCDTVVEVTCELGVHTDTELMGLALKRRKLNPVRTTDGWSFTGGKYTKGGKLTMASANGYSTLYEAQIAAIKQGYSHEVVRSTARKSGWIVTEDRNDSNKLHVRRLS